MCCFIFVCLKNLTKGEHYEINTFKNKLVDSEGLPLFLAIIKFKGLFSE